MLLSIWLIVFQKKVQYPSIFNQIYSSRHILTITTINFFIYIFIYHFHVRLFVIRYHYGLYDVNLG